MMISPTDVTFSAWAVWLVSWMVAALWSSRVERRSRSHADNAYRLLTTIGAVLLFDPRLSWQWTSATVWRAGNITGWILAATTISGFAVAWSARITLGRLWSGSVTRKVDHEIITAGPYRMVRHPIYSGLLLSAGATAALRGTAAAVLGATVIGVGLFVKGAG